MSLSNINDVRRGLEAIADLPPTAKRRKIIEMIEIIEMNSLYYAEMGKPKGVALMDECLKVLRAALDAVTSA